jgi:phosphonate transport system substrate-binding protein
MKKLFPLVLLGLFACGLMPHPQPVPTPAATVTLTSTPAASSLNQPLGSDKNPLVLALAPSARPMQDVINAGNVLTAALEKSTGYTFVSVIPPDEMELIKAFGNGNAHIGVLTPFGYLLAYDQGYVTAAFARQQNGNTFYGAQFLVRSDAGFTSYYDSIKAQNTAEASTALAQFAGKKPCWADAYSPSGYVVPLGFLGEAGVATLEPAFMAGQPTVVRAVYAGGICDFGATYIDARTYPGLEDSYPDVMRKVIVVWQIPPIIPYDTMVFASGMTIDMRRALTRAFVDLMSTPDGSSAMQTLYGFNAMSVVQDGQYNEFRKAVRASGLDLNTLVK